MNFVQAVFAKSNATGNTGGVKKLLFMYLTVDKGAFDCFQIAVAKQIIRL